MKTALITGAAGGMGKACAQRFLREGWTVYGLDLRDPGLPGLRFLRADLTDEADIEAAFRTVRAGVRHLDAVVHMAGLYDLNSLVEIPDTDVQRIFGVNLFAAWRVNRIFLPLLGEGSRVVVTSSELAPLDPLPFTGVYAVTKAAADKYALSLRMELQLLGIGVSVLRPGAVDTGMLDASRARLDAFCGSTTHYGVDAARFRRIVEGFESRRRGGAGIPRRDREAAPAGVRHQPPAPAEPVLRAARPLAERRHPPDPARRPEIGDPPLKSAFFVFTNALPHAILPLYGSPRGG